MTQAYSNPKRANDAYSLPDLELFELTARERAEQDEELIFDYMERPEFRLASMNSQTREAMFDAMIEEEGIRGGWFYWFCFPGCMPDSDAMGPFDSYKEALEDARQDCEDYEEDSE